MQHGGIAYVYDGDGNRVSKTVGGETTNYLVDMLNPTGYAQVLEELESGGVARSYTWGLQLVSKLETVDSKLSWYGFDGHGSMRQLFSESGTVTDTYDYDAFGNLISSTGSTANNYLFAGEQYDPDLGLYYNRARYLDVRSGRFWGMDTDEGAIADPVSLHKYLYAGADPANKVDPSGNEIEEFTMANAISIGLMVMNAYSLVGNSVQGARYSLAAYSAFQADDPWNGTIAIGGAILHFGLAAASAYGINALKNLPPPPPTAVCALSANVSMQMLWVNPAFTAWAWGFLWPAVTAGVGIYASSTQHTAQWELRNSNGQIKTRGEAVSGGSNLGRRLNWIEQRATDTEVKILELIRNLANPGDILTIRGTKPPCDFCDRAMFEAAKRLGIKILYSDEAGYVSQY